MSTALSVSKLEASIDKKAAGEIAVSRSGMVVESMSQVMEIAKLMALGKEAIPKHLRDNPGACLSVAIQAYEWQISPFALANKTYVVNDRLAYEAALYQAVVTRRAPIKGRIKMSFTGDGATRECRVWAALSDGTGDVEYTSPKFGTINPKNSPLWKNDPDQQLYYFSVRAFARRHFPDVMMGIYTVDELLDNPREDGGYGEPNAASNHQARVCLSPLNETHLADLPKTAAAQQQRTEAHEPGPTGEEPQDQSTATDAREPGDDEEPGQGLSTAAQHLLDRAAAVKSEKLLVGIRLEVDTALREMLISEADAEELRADIDARIEKAKK